MNICGGQLPCKMIEVCVLRGIRGGTVQADGDSWNMTCVFHEENLFFPFFCNGNNYITGPLQPIDILIVSVCVRVRVRVCACVCVCVRACVCVCSLGLQYRTSWCSAGLLWNSAEGLDRGWAWYTHISALIKTLSWTFTYSSGDMSGG